MTIKTFVFCSLVLGSFPLQLQAKKNAFANEKIDHNFIKFTTVEIINDFQKAIGEYNANRKNPNALSGSIDSPFYRTKLESNLKGKNELPEIIKSDGYYSLHDGPNTIQFSIDLILKNQFYLNGKIYSLDKDSKNFDPKFFSTYFHKVIDFLITQSMAGEEFIASPESTRLLVAGIIALDGSFEKIGITCVFSCKEKASKINNDKLVKRINEYTEECEKNLGDQAHTFDLYNRTKDLFDISDIVTVGSADYEKTYKLLTKMSEVQEKGNDKKIISNSFEQDMSQNTCFEQIRNTYKMWISNARMMSDERESLDQQARGTCQAIDGLKSCLSNFHAQSKMIYDSTSRQYKEQMNHEERQVPAVNGISK